LSQQSVIREEPEPILIEEIIGVKSDHELEKVPRRKCYRLKLKPSNIFQVQNGSFNQITIKIVSASHNQLVVHRSNGTSKYVNDNDNIVLKYAEDFTIHNRSGTKTATLELKIDLIRAE
jgi:hypothetical protein